MKTATSQIFNQEVLQSTVPVVCNFGASWCGPCRTMKPLLESLDNDSEGRFKVVSVDLDESNDLVEKYGVSAIPTILIFENGLETKRFVGLTSKQDLLKVVIK